ncbi:MAG: monovalent cation/H+ antiporter subunit D [Candidatus Competibacteraceae bacterium]|nr:monovalent cation/H+ antiporter subunit D [Candidatus Competibacteraceae bacterium]MBK8962916.1 monovalent cation/H+ antiporter subunit D [Candidatus Competibacteraceae bacterium]
MNHWVIAPVLLPWSIAILLLLAGRASLGWRRGASVAAVAAQIGLALALALEVSDGDILVYALGHWPAPFGIVLVADRLAAWMLVVTAFLALFALLYAIRGDDAAGAHFHSLFQLQLFGLNGAFLTGDLFNLFVFFEVLLIASYGLLLHGGGRRRTRAGLQFVAVNVIGSTLFLFAVGTLYGVLGTLNMADLALEVAATPPADALLVRAAGLLLFGVFALKAALLPFYLWLPAAYAQTSAPVAALFAIMTKVGAYSILRVYPLLFGAGAGLVADLIEPWLLPLALATLGVGMLGALASTQLRQQIAYLMVASVGSLLLAFGLNNAAGIAAGLYYLPHTTFAAAALFLLADSIARRRGELGDRLDPGPTVASAGVLGSLFFVAAVAVAGLPPLSGFLGKFLTLRAALAHPWSPWIMTVVLVAGLFGLIALGRTGSLLFYRTLPPATPPALEESSELARELAPAVGLLLLVVGMTVAAGPIAESAQATAAQILQPQRYIQAVIKPRGIL